jgi:hypothetical protein
MDFTMLRQICRRGRLTASIQSSIASGNPSSKTLRILVSQHTQTDVEAEPLTMSTVAETQYNGQGTNLPSQMYDLILRHINMLHPLSSFRHFKNLPHPIDANVLPKMAVPLHHIKYKERNYSTFSIHSGNSSISYRSKNGSVDAGFITAIWSQVLMGKLHSFIVVSPHKPLSADDEQRNPYQSKLGFCATLVYSQQPESHDKVVVEQEQIIGHVAYYIRPQGTFGIKEETMVLIDSLHRNRE